ncbi:hypothetical protein UlMin_008835 [Ulmus minor]
MASSKDGDPSLGYLTQKDTEVKILRATKILQEAREHQEAEIRQPKQKIRDPTELADYNLRKRKEFEDLFRRVRWNKDFNRAHSVLGQALEIDYRNHTLWLMYAEVEMKNKFINHARSVWDRAITLLPREILENVAGARQIFERWMNWMPDQQGWFSYIKFELQYNKIDWTRAIFERFFQCPLKVGAWIWFAKFELKNGEVGRARTVYERALFIAFAEFKEWCKESERARCIYKFALEHIPKGMAEDLYRQFVALEKQYGDKEGIEDAIVGKKSPLSYDTWFNYIRLKESMGNTERIREVFEIAIVLRLRRNGLTYEELDARDVERTRECLKLIRHEKFSLPKYGFLQPSLRFGKVFVVGAGELLCVWCKYVELEKSLSETKRMQSIFELAIAQLFLNMPELFISKSELHDLLSKSLKIKNKKNVIIIDFESILSTKKKKKKQRTYRK